MTAQLTRSLPRSSGPARSRPQLSPVQITASALAAVSAAVVSSFFGVAGTVIGAAVASVISTISAAVYSESLRRTNDRLRTALRGQAPATRPMIRTAEPAPTAHATPATAGRSVPGRLDPRRGRSGRRRWIVVAVSAVAVFVAAMAVITVVEFLGQRPVSALVGGSSSTGTTIGDLTTTSSGHGSGPAAPAAPSGAAGSSAPVSGAPASPATASSGAAASSSAAPTAQVGPSSASASASPSTSGASATSEAPPSSPAPTPAGSSPSSPAATGAAPTAAVTP